MTTIKSSRSAIVTLLLCIFLGSLGIHRFYVGKVGTGILMLLTAGGFGIWVIVDIVLIASEQFKDKEGNTLEFEKIPMSTIKKILVVILSVFAGIVVLILLIVALAFFLTRGLVEPINEQLAAIRNNNLVVAYSYTSKEFQKKSSMDDFKNFLTRFPVIKNNQSAHFPNREFENGEGIIKGTITAKDGTAINIEYRVIKENGAWKILGMKVSPPKIETAPAKQVSTKAIEPPALLNTYKDEKNKFSIQYPDTWTYEQPNADKVIFNGRKGTPSYDSTIHIQTLPSKKNGGEYQNEKEVVNDLKKQISSKATNIVVLGEGPVEVSQNNEKLNGRVFVFNYNYEQKPYKQMLFVLPTKDGKAFYIWTFNSTKNQYSVDLPTAKMMFESWVIDTK